MISIDYIREYLVLAETLNFSKAADKMYIAQSALSRHIAMIEDDMGGKLFERDTKHVELTPAGQAVREQFEGIIQKYEQAQELTRGYTTGEEGSITIVCPFLSLEDYVEPVLYRFHELHPGCIATEHAVQSPFDRIQELIEGSADIDVQIGDISDPRIVRKPFATEPIAAIVLEDHPLAERESLSIDEIADAGTFVTMDSSGASGDDWHDRIIGILAKHGIELEQIYYAKQIELIGPMLRKTGGVGIAPYCIRRISRDYLRVIPFEDADCRQKLSMYYLSDNPNPLLPQMLEVATQIGGSLGK